MRLRVRAYNVGFGDCILLSWDEPDRMHHAWVDFGTHSSDKVINYQAVVDDVVATTGGQLDLLMVTHRHLDHLGGFYSMWQQLHDKLHIDRIWHAWVTAAIDSKFELATQAAAALLPPELLAGPSVVAGIYQNNLALTTRDRMDKIETLALPAAVFKIHRELDLTEALPAGWSEMHIDVLGPEKDSSKYLQSIDTSMQARAALDSEFDRFAAAGVPASIDATASGAVESADDPAAVPDFMKLADFARLRRLLRGGGTDLLAAVNTSRNNTSIVTRWRWKDVTLLMTGDAELESWHYLRENGANVGATLVKVGHHGSINASPTWGYEQVFPKKRAGNAVLLSTNPAIFHGINPDPHPDVVAGWTGRLRYPVSRFRRTDAVERGASVEFVFDRP
jgi:hypothetical protein